ncbi:retrotransposon protein, putative, ty1-copia subclass [Tanacetum coccineum]
MLMTMEPEIQQNLENLHANDMLKELKTLFAQQNYNMHSLGKTVNELYVMLKLHEQTMSKNNAPDLHAIRAGHWKRDCPQYLAELLKKKKNIASGAGGSGIFTIKLNTFLNRSWIYDTGYGTYICNTTHGLRESRKLKSGALSLYVGNGQREVVEAIGFFYLCLPSGLEIVLNNCHYAPSITRGVIYVSRLYEDDFMNNTIQVSRNNMVYFSAIPRDGIFKFDLSNSYANESSIYTVSNKRAELDLDSSLLWHFRLGHISKKHIEKLQHGELLNSTDLKAFEKCVPCMSRKMARKPYIHRVERAEDLLGLIHTDVCGPFKIMSRQGASYFVTFTNYFSRYGYVYLLKHKHEVFETFKVFQKEVENQLAHRTPPYTPQHNGVSERRNRTLLDMVRSMMSQTTLPKSFWDYALETAAHILNMVPTKKVEKTPYENKVLVARNSKFLENSLITQKASGSLKDLEIIQDEDTHPSIDTSLNHEEDDLEIDEPQSDINIICRSTRTRRPTDRLCLYIDAEEHKLGDLGEPVNYKAALLDPEFDKWLNAMNVEKQSMKDNEVWDLVDLPPNGKTIGSKWLFKKKTDLDGAVHTYKARLMAKGYTQTLGIDYEETFSPVADIRAIRILIAIAAFYDYKIWQMDVKTALLNGYLSKEVYMEQLKCSNQCFIIVALELSKGTNPLQAKDIPPPTIIAMKIPIIRKGEYDIWSMRMRQYICHTDHDLWDVIANRDLEEDPIPTGETSAPPAPKTAKQLAA